MMLSSPSTVRGRFRLGDVDRNAWCRQMFPAAERVVYEKNQLEEVICQLRFPQILRIDAEPPSQFQDAIRKAYPLYSEEDPTGGLGAQLSPEVARLVKGVFAGPTVKLARRFSSSDQAWVVSLASNFIALSTRVYRRWSDFFEHFREPLTAFTDIYEPAFFARIGLRYRNALTRSALGLNDQPWSELLAPHVAAELVPLASGVMEAQHQLLFDLNDDLGSRVRLTHGLARNPKTNEETYVLDADFSRSSARRFKMQKATSLTTIERPDAFSLGVSASAYIQPWDLDPSTWTLGSARNLFAQSTTGNTVGSSADDWFDARIRTLCHVLVEALPPRALAELSTALSSMWHYYSAEPSLYPGALPAKKVVGKITAREQRASFFASEE